MTARKSLDCSGEKGQGRRKGQEGKDEFGLRASNEGLIRHVCMHGLCKFVNKEQIGKLHYIVISQFKYFA